MPENSSTDDLRKIDGDPDELSLLLLSDCTVHPPSEIVEAIRQYSGPVDAILYGGDGLYRLNQEDTNHLQILAKEAEYGLFAVAGNDDPPHTDLYVTGDGVYDVHKSPVVLGDFAIVGNEGIENREDRFCPGINRYDRKEMEGHLRSALEKVGDRIVILVSHHPPAGILDRSVRYGDTEQELGLGEEKGYNSRGVGSRAVASVLQDFNSIRVVVCGHTHLMGGRTKRMDDGRYVVNVASHDNQNSELKIGKVVLTDRGTVRTCTGKLSRRELWKRDIDDLRSIPGVGRKTAEKLIDLDIESKDDLARTSPKRLREEIPHSSRSWDTLVARAKAHHTDEPVILDSPDFPDSNRVYLDVETDLDQMSLVWLVGIYPTWEEEMTYFYAETPGDERSMLKSFLAFLDHNPEATLLHYSTLGFDERVLRYRLEANNLSVPRDLEESIDVGKRLEKCVALPTVSHTLSDVAGHAGYEFAHSEMGGREVANIYLRCIEEGKEVPEKVFEYNRDDVLAVKRIVNWMETESAGEEVEEEEDGEGEKHASVSHSARTSRTAEMSPYEPVAEKLDEIGDDKAVVLSDLRKTDVHALMSDMYQRFGQEYVAVQYREQGDGTWKAVVSKR